MCFFLPYFFFPVECCFTVFAFIDLQNSSIMPLPIHQQLCIVSECDLPFYFFYVFFFFQVFSFLNICFFYHMYECFLDSCLCTTRAPGALGGQKRTPDSLKLEFNMDMSHHVVLRIEPRSFTRAASALSHQAICPALLGRVS